MYPKPKSFLNGHNKLNLHDTVRVFIYMSIRRVPIQWDSYEVVTDRLVRLHRGERNVDKLGLGFDFRTYACNHNLDYVIKNILKQ